MTRSASANAAAAAGTSRVSSRSMPSYCEPWPGKTITTRGRAAAKHPWKMPCCSSTCARPRCRIAGEPVSVCEQVFRAPRRRSPDARSALARKRPAGIVPGSARIGNRAVERRQQVGGGRAAKTNDSTGCGGRGRAAGRRLNFGAGLVCVTAAGCRASRQWHGDPDVRESGSRPALSTSRRPTRVDGRPVFRHARERASPNSRR